MEQLHTDSTGPEEAAEHDSSPDLSDYVKRMETPENIEKLAKKLSKDRPAQEDAPDLSYENFSKKMRDAGQ